MTELFYPGQREESDSLVPDMHGTVLQRRRGFLEEMSSDAYHSVYHHICEHPEIVFSDVQKLLKTTKEEGRIMMQVMTHVVAWLNPNPAIVMDRRENNKPLLREDLKPALQATATNKVAEVWETGVEEISKDLERRILDAVQDEMTSFKTPPIKATLNFLPADGRNEYGQRFIERPWKTVLEKFKQVCGPEFGSLLTFALPTCESDQVSPCRPASIITRAICELGPQIPEVIKNPALGSQEACEELAASIDKVVTQWVVQRCHRELETCKFGAESMGSSEVLQIIEATKTRSGQYAKATELWNASSEKSGKNTTDSAPPITTASLEQNGTGISGCQWMASLPGTGSTETPACGELRTSSSSKSPQPQVAWTPFQALFLRNES